MSEGGRGRERAGDRTCAKADLPSAGASKEVVRRKKVSYRGTQAEPTGASSPQLASSAETSMLRISDDLPAMLGAVSSHRPSKASVLAVAARLLSQ